MSLIVAGVDLETTDLDAEKGAQIIEIALALAKVSVKGGVTEVSQLRPTFCIRVEPTVSINQKAFNVHGISMADLKGERKWEDVAPVVMKVLGKADLLVAHNIAFDAPFLFFELQRVGLTMPNIETFCTMENGRTATALGKNPTLGELCWAFDVDYDESGAHAADYDIDRTMLCFKKGLEQRLFNLPKISKATLRVA